MPLTREEMFEQFSRIRMRIQPRGPMPEYSEVPPEWLEGLRWAYDKACEDCAAEMGPDMQRCSEEDTAEKASELCLSLKHTKETDATD